jgi:hypothetical protein
MFRRILVVGFCHLMFPANSLANALSTISVSSFLKPLKVSSRTTAPPSIVLLSMPQEDVVADCCNANLIRGPPNQSPGHSGAFLFIATL